MTMLSDQPLEVVSKEDPRNRAYWTGGRSLSLSAQKGLVAAEILIVPWEKFREERDLFPEYTTEFFKFIQHGQFASKFAIACDEEAYFEIHLHGNSWRLPTLFLAYIALPLAVNIAAAFLYEKMTSPAGQDHVEVTFIIEPPASTHPCISLSYKGPVSEFPQKVLAEAERCFSAAPPQPKSDKRVNVLDQKKVRPMAKSTRNTE
jgi:hypothetical protein